MGVLIDRPESIADANIRGVAMPIEEMIDALWRSIRQGVHDPEALPGKLSIDDAYRVQLGLLGRYEQAGDRLVGWKVGLTAKAIQAQLGYYEPVFGFLLRVGISSVARTSISPR